MSDIQKISVFDERIVQRSPMQYAVEQGAVSSTNTNFAAISQTISQHTYQLQVPSENVFVDKALDWTSTVALQFNVVNSATKGTSNTNGPPVIQFGKDIALNAFPLHTLVSTLSATINDTTVTMNTSDILFEVLRLADSAKNRELRTCPSYLDTYASYNDAAGTNNNPLAGYENATTNGVVPNGAYYNVYFTSPSGVALDGNGSYSIGGSTVYYVKGVPSIAKDSVANVANTWPVFIKFTTVEKLVLSPFCFSDVHDNETGLFGIQNIQVVANMMNPSSDNTATIGRVLRFTTAATSTISAVNSIAYNTNALGGAFSSSAISCVFLTPSLSLPLPSKSVVPYAEFPRYTQNVTLSSNLNSGATSSTQQSQTITLPTIPDLILIYAKPTAYLPTDASYYLPITNISVNFDNFSGLLSSYTSSELFALSQNNGLQMNWNEWNGQALKGLGGLAGQFVGLVGGFLVIKPSRDITLQTAQAPSVVGNYTLQFNYNLYNPSSAAITSYTLTTVTVNSGFFESIKGSSRVVKGVLSQKDVIEADAKGAVTRVELNRFVGGKHGSLMHSLSTGVQKAMPIIRSLVPHLKKYLPEEAQEVMGAFGLGKHGKHHGLSKRLM
jgi:hypothetical protein